MSQQKKFNCSGHNCECSTFFLSPEVHFPYPFMVILWSYVSREYNGNFHISSKLSGLLNQLYYRTYLYFIFFYFWGDTHNGTCLISLSYLLAVFPCYWIFVIFSKTQNIYTRIVLQKILQKEMFVALPFTVFHAAK